MNTCPQPFKAGLNYCPSAVKESDQISQWTEIKARETSAGYLESWSPQNNKILQQGIWTSYRIFISGRFQYLLFFFF